MMDRLSNPAKIIAFDMAEDLKELMRPLFRKHQDDIMTGEFSRGMMADWANDDKKLLTWREETAETGFEKAPRSEEHTSERQSRPHLVCRLLLEQNKNNTHRTRPRSSR